MEPKFEIPELESVENIRQLISKNWKVVLWNDNTTPFQVVVVVVAKALNCCLNEAARLTKKAHDHGRVVIALTDRAEADDIATDLRAVGLKVTIERTVDNRNDIV